MARRRSRYGKVYMTGLKISCTWLCQVKQKLITEKLFEIAQQTKAHCIAYGFLFKSYAGLFLVKCIIFGILPHLCWKNAKKRCFSITNIFEGQLWRCTILKVLITHDSNFAYTLTNIFSKQNFLEKCFLSIFVGVISIIAKSGRLQMGLNLMKKCVFFHLSSCYPLEENFSHKNVSPLPVGTSIAS